MERGEVESPDADVPRVEDKATGGRSIKGDLFGDDAPTEANPRGRGKKEKKKGGISLDDDLFGDPAAPPPPPPPPPPPRKKRRRPKSLYAPWALTGAEHTAAAERLVKRVAAESRYGVRAKFLEGVILYKTGRANDALNAFKAVVAATRDAETPTDERLRQMAFFQLARTHFGAEQPSFSIFYYDKVDRDALAWLDALYEGSWAEFRLGNYEKALGNLLTLHSPFFTDSYYPESLILKAVVYYENCRYPETKEILRGFLERYEPVHDELKRLTARKESYERFYETLAQLRQSSRRRNQDGNAATLGQVLDIALSDPELDRLDQAFKELETERVRIERSKGAFKASPLFPRLEKIHARVRRQLASAAGKALKNQLERERGAINELIQQALRINVETARSEQERIESRLRAVQQRPKRVENTFVEWTDDEKLVWPFEGEYWRDELGTYELTLSHTCR